MILADLIDLKSNFPATSNGCYFLSHEDEAKATDGRVLHLAVPKPNNAVQEPLSSGTFGGAMYVNAHAHVCIVGGC